MDSWQSALNQCGKTNWGCLLKNKKKEEKNPTAFWVFVGTLRTCFQALLFCPKGWKAALNTRKQSPLLPLPTTTTSWNAYEHFAPGAVAVRKNHYNHQKTWQHQGHASRGLFPITVNHRLSPVCCETSNCGSLNTINRATIPWCTWLVFVEARGKFTLLPRARTEDSWCFSVARWGTIHNEDLQINTGLSMPPSPFARLLWLRQPLY